mmetsp:Transcript_31770/g.23532  ORF Transcript_31770/g.23532 Transcript_31770/m.23532 type:complete len:102 (-) Transcript_31770:357-662(-)|eukprot:CAMPEP_0202959724 /NCGR_PEP_ID=MMETSP1396-20130829/3898_1 /ASSEMBLY_ACC=CAM_ASM_000872 /TAXON_ID= /ORGANISM="Pseudokeronopsis sp., Strain Brazil" /LENGTH=101 /DNA_ID=CAMNT_0049678439 /DNA_START=207 /DNA_END=512 /DNA_ORIENTATION=-
MCGSFGEFEVRGDILSPQKLSVPFGMGGHNSEKLFMGTLRSYQRKNVDLAQEKKKKLLKEVLARKSLEVESSANNDKSTQASDTIDFKQLEFGLPNKLFLT